MIKEIAVPVPEKEIVREEKKVPENLRQRAYLNSVSSIIDFAGVQITGLITSPFIVAGLGSSMYGIWRMLGQMTGYAGLADTRATQVLKWTVAKKKDIAGDEELKNDLTSAFVVTTFMMPLVLIAGGIISWYAPYITKADAAYHDLVRITCSLLILSLVISKVFDLFDAVLRGMNLGFKRMGFRAAIVVCGGGLKILVITQGFGLIGLSVVQILVTVITGLTFYFIVKRSVPWFGFGKTNFKKVIEFSKLSGWNMANSTTDTLLTSTDKVLLGLVAGPVLVSSYALTTFLPLAIQGLIMKGVLGVMPGMGKLLGLQDYSKIKKVREVVNDFIYILITASGVTIILFNDSFLNAWVGKGFFAGPMANTLIMLMVIQDAFIKHDGYIITATLDLKKKVFLTCVSAIVFIASGIVLVHSFGIIGLCISLLLGKLLLFIGQRKVLNKKIQQSSNPFSNTMRPLLTSTIMLGAACYFSSLMEPVGWWRMLLLAPVAFALSFFIFYTIGLKKQRREELVKITSSLKFFKLS